MLCSTSPFLCCQPCIMYDFSFWRSVTCQVAACISFIDVLVVPCFQWWHGLCYHLWILEWLHKPSLDLQESKAGGTLEVHHRKGAEVALWWHSWAANCSTHHSPSLSRLCAPLCMRVCHQGLSWAFVSSSEGLKPHHLRLHFRVFLQHLSSGLAFFFHGPASHRTVLWMVWPDNHSWAFSNWTSMGDELAQSRISRLMTLSCHWMPMIEWGPHMWNFSSCLVGQQ